MKNAKKIIAFLMALTLLVSTIQMPVLDEDYIQSNFQEWTNDIPVMVGSVFGEMNCWTALDPNETNKNSWTEKSVRK